MECDLNDTTGYDLRESLILGGSASIGVILTFFFLDRISYHPVFNTSTIDEMVSYAQIFFISFFSYFAAAVTVWKWGSRLSRKLPLWFPISTLGSVLFAFSIALLVYATQPSESTFGPNVSCTQVLLYTITFSLCLTLFTGIFTSVASSIYVQFSKNTSLRLGK